MPGQRAGPRFDGLELTSVDVCQPVGRDQLRGRSVVAGSPRVADRLRHEALGDVPAEGAMVQLRDRVGLGERQLMGEEIAGQLVKAIPRAAFVQRHQEQVRAFELRQQPGGSVPLQDRVAQ